MAKYLHDQARDREQARARLAGLRAQPMSQQAAPAVTSSRPAETTTGLEGLLQQIAASLAPKAVNQTPTADLRVAPGGMTPPSGGGGEGGGGGGDGGLGGMLNNLKGLGQKKGADVRDRSATSVAEREQRRRDSTPGPYAKGQAAIQYVQDKIPGLQPAIDTSVPKAGEPPRKMAYPSEPAARAYMQEQRTDIPPIRMEEKGGGTGYKADLQYLNDHGAHYTVMKDGKKENVPLGTKGNYGDIKPELAARLRAAGEMYEKETGKKPRYGESSRGEDVQKTYWEDSAHGTKYAAAPPGRSRHQTGDAMDLPGEGGFQQWLTEPKNGDRVGLHFPVKGDAPHVQVNPKVAQTFAKPDGPELPPWEGLPVQPKPDTQWGDPKVATPVAAQPPGPIAAGGDRVLADQRAGFKAEADANPTFREHAAAIMISESSTPEGQQGTFEAMLNRVKANNRPLNDAIDPNYHADYMVRNRGKFDAALAKVKNDPKLREQVYGLQDKAFNGSNVSKLATDYAGPGRAERSAKTSTETYASPDGQRFFRKDLDPNEDGPGQVAANKKWHAETSAAMTQPTGAGSPAVAAPSDTGSAEAMARDVITTREAPAGTTPGTVTTGGAETPPKTAPPSAEVFEKGAEPITAPGVGGLQEDVDYAGMQPTARTTQDSAGEALNAIQKPAAATPISPVAAPAAAAPAAAAPAAAAPLPPPVVRQAPPPGARAATPPLTPDAVKAQPKGPDLTGLHKALDTNFISFIKGQGAGPAEIAQAGPLSGYTVREALNSPIFGRLLRGNAGFQGTVANELRKYGVDPKDFEKHVASPPPPPGKQSAVQGERATDFSARARTPMAPPGLEQGKVPTPRERPQTAPTFDPGSQPAVQNADGTISTVRTMGIEDNGKEVNIPTVPAEGGRIMSDREAVQRYQDTGRHLGKFDSIEEAGAAAEALHQAEAQQQSQHPQGQQPTMTPEMAKAFENLFKDQSRVPQLEVPPDAQPVLPSSQPGTPGVPGGLSLAPPGLQNLTTPGAGPFQNAFMPASQGGSIATAGFQPQQTGVFSTPLLDAAAQQQQSPSAGLFSGGLTPWASGGFGGFGGFNGFNTSGNSGFGGLFDSGSASSMFSGVGGLFPTPGTWGG